jgi:helicase MOV-10
MFSFSIKDVKGTVPKLPYHFVQQREITITITLLPLTQIGRFEDRLELTFSSHLDREKFVITRPLHAIVGVKADHESLNPRAPYIPNKRRTYSREERVIPGVRPPALEHVDLRRGTLLQWEVPTALAEVLKAKGGQSAVLKIIKNRFLPRALSYDTYKQWFGVLLHIEEEKAQ